MADEASSAFLKLISKFSKKDADAYPKYEALLTEISSVLEPMMTMVPPNPGKLSFGDLASTWFGRAAAGILASRIAFELGDEPVARREAAATHELVERQGEQYLRSYLEVQQVRVALLGGGLDRGVEQLAATTLPTADVDLRRDPLEVEP